MSFQKVHLTIGGSKMADGQEVHTKEQLRDLDNEQLLEYIKKLWALPLDEPLEVIGRLQAEYNNNHKRYFYRLTNVATKNGRVLEYPMMDLQLNQMITNNGIFIPSFNINNSIKKLAEEGSRPLVKCVLELATIDERKKHDLPLLLRVSKYQIDWLEELDPEILKGIDQEVSVENWLIEYLKVKHQEHFSEKSRALLEEENVLVEKISQYKKEFEEIENKYDEVQSRLQQSEELNIRKQEELGVIEKRLSEIQEQLAREEEIMGKKLEKFRSFIREKADKLLQLDLLDLEEYNEIMMVKETSEKITESLHFEIDLHSDFTAAVKHIQAYLYQKDIIYPKYVIEDFFALVKTNDLIILAGDSGSGKTNLVKSFADAIGGRSVIIPVKPNWTSSEDLLGYYNPLEKKYLATPFLEALLEASHNPDVPYFICLDEMNLARVEYYFADFLSLLEERNELPEIKLYSEDESAHVLLEFKHVITLIDAAKEKYKKNNLVNFMELLQDEDVNRELKNVFGLSDKDSLIKYHSDLRRMLHGIINTPSSITFPKNVRIIGTVNIDETTHYLAPKILDRAHVMKFDSPLLYDWKSIASEIDTPYDNAQPLKLELENLGVRSPYPSFNKDGEFESIVMLMHQSFFSKLGIEVGLRTIRQALNYQLMFNQFAGEEDTSLVLNNFVLHKILPKITFDGTVKVEGKEKIELLKEMQENLNELCESVGSKGRKSCVELESMITRAKENDGIVNYWA